MRLQTRAFVIAAALAVASPALAFDVTDTDGKRHRLADYRGKWVVVNFWATWCTPCIKEIPEIADFKRANAQRAVVLGIALDVDDADKTKRFAAKFGHDYPLVLEDDATEKQFGRAKGLPTTFIYGPDGKRAWERTGTVTRQSLEQAISGAAKPKG
ncbi:MAG: TlpA family protein disulfide reductase [Burkholderiales bacterium]|nr:TlpA family protein disulfide reductase [Burkholderiales bacterium]MCL4690269.1 TlpA family protein disulfide reductase [Burkholderiales bacterium]